MKAYYENIHNAKPKDAVPTAHLLIHMDDLGPPPRDAIFFPSHWHDALEIIVVLEGRVAVRTDSSVLYAGVGESLLIAANQIHSLHADPEGSNNLYYCLIIHQEFFKNYGLYTNAFITQGLGANKEVAALVKSIYDEHTKKELHHSTLIKAKTLELLVYLLRNQATLNYSEETAENKQVFAVKKAIDYINNNFHRNITLEDICAEVCLSRYYLSRVFKENTGQTVSDFIMNQRCIHAQNLIASGNYSLGQIAELCGFNSSTYFSTVFKKYKGIAPSKMIRTASTTEDSEEPASETKHP